MNAVNPLAREQLRARLLQPDIISGSEALLRSLLLEDVECVFGYPGGAVLYIYDAFYDFYGLRHLLARHEQGAIHAADGYARASGRTGVCIATSGPGATNLITGIALAYKDRIPLVVITGNVGISVRGTDAFQEADVIGMTLPITKHSYYVTDAADIPGIVREAFEVASTGQPGPVLIDIPKDISGQKKRFDHGKKRAVMPCIKPALPDDAVSHQSPDVLVQLAGARDPMLQLLGMIADTLPADAVVTADELRFRAMLDQSFTPAWRGSIICPAGMEAPGYSLPAAIGAQLAYPERTVISINGESGIHKCTQELAVCANQQLPLKIVVFSERDSSLQGSPDFMKLADAYGLKGYKAVDAGEARELWNAALDEKGPVLVEFPRG